MFRLRFFLSVGSYGNGFRFTTSDETERYRSHGEVIVPSYYSRSLTCANSTCHPTTSN